MRRHVFIFIAGLATGATLSLWPLAVFVELPIEEVNALVQ
jgi:hypothetical protein